MPPRRSDLEAALADHTRALEARILAERLRALGAEAAHRAVLDIADGRRDHAARKTPSARAAGWLRVEG
jgi:hypothetical protein